MFHLPSHSLNRIDRPTLEGGVILYIRSYIKFSTIHLYEFVFEILAVKIFTNASNFIVCIILYNYNKCRVSHYNGT